MPQYISNYDVKPYLKELMMFATPDQCVDSRSLVSTYEMDSANNFTIFRAYKDHGASICSFIFGRAGNSKLVVTRNQNYIRFFNSGTDLLRQPSGRVDGNYVSASNDESRSSPYTQ